MPEAQVILRTLKRYGMILADNGSPWYISGAPDERWNNAHLRELGRFRGSDFEAVDASSLMLDPNSGQVRPIDATPTDSVTRPFTPTRTRTLAPAITATWCYPGRLWLPVILSAN